MKRTGSVWLLLAGIMAIGIFLGCETLPEFEEEREAEAAAPAAHRVPITQDIINLVIKSGKNVESLKYYISTSITLVNWKKEENLEIINGAVLLQIKEPLRLRIDQDTEAKYIRTLRKNGSQIDRFVVGFNAKDQDGKEHEISLYFKDNKTKFDLVYDETRQLANKTDRYLLDIDGDNPHLLISYREEFVKRGMDRSVSPNLSRY